MTDQSTVPDSALRDFDGMNLRRRGTQFGHQLVAEVANAVRASGAPSDATDGTVLSQRLNAQIIFDGELVFSDNTPLYAWS